MCPKPVTKSPRMKPFVMDLQIKSRVVSFKWQPQLLCQQSFTEKQFQIVHFFLGLGDEYVELNWFEVKSISLSCLCTLVIFLISSVEEFFMELLHWYYFLHSYHLPGHLVSTCQTVSFARRNLWDTMLLTFLICLTIRLIISYVLHCPNFSIKD